MLHTTPPGVEPRALYDNKVRQVVLDRILDDGMSTERVIASMTACFLVLLIDRYWERERAMRQRWQEEFQPTVRNRLPSQAGTTNRVA